MRTVGGTPEELAAAWLHDSVEDTAVTLEQIREQFGDTVAMLVDGLTDPPDFASYSTLARKTRQAERVVNKHASIKRIKIADQTANIHMMGFDPPVSWNLEKRRDYLEGARRIALNCSGVDEHLDKLFAETYQKVAAVILSKN